MSETRINSLTNRKIKIGARVYNKLIASGMIDDGTSVIRVIRYITIENHTQKIEFDSPAYEKFINIGYTLDAATDELKAPVPYIYKQTYGRDRRGIMSLKADFNDEALNSLRTLKGIIRINGMSLTNNTNKDIRQHMSVGMYDNPQIEISIYYQSHILPEYGVVYHGELNCVIRLYEQHLKTNDYKKSPKHITKLYNLYQDGFFSSDFDDLARKLGANIYVRTPINTYKYGEYSKLKNMYLYINNNHCNIDTKTPTVKITEYVNNIDDYLQAEKLNITRYNKGVSLSTDTKIYKNKILKHTNLDNSIIEYHTEDYKFNFESQTGLYLNLFIIANPSIISIKKDNKNIEAIRSISQHGLFYATDREEPNVNSKYTYDIKKAYYNYSQWHIYEGIPTDLDNAITASAYLSNPNILEYAGFGMVEYTDILQPDNIKITRWVSNPFIKMLIRQGRIFNYKYGLISRNKVDLNLECFLSKTETKSIENTPNINSTTANNEPQKMQLSDDPNLNSTTPDTEPKKNTIWYKVVGKMNQRTIKQMITTTDPLLAYSGLNVSHDIITSNGEDIKLYFGEKQKNEPCRQYYPHISAYIQFYTEILINELAMTAKSQGAEILSIWVDEITFNKKIDLTPTQIEYFHTDKISKIANFDCKLNYRYPQPPVKYSKHFNPIIQNKGNKIILQGGAGCGKTYICNQLHDQMENLDIITPTHQSGSIYKNNDKEYTTVASKIKHINPAKGAREARNIICDEMSMINKDEQQLLETITPPNNLIMFIGDPKQLLPIQGEAIETNEYSIIELFKNYRQAIDPEFSRKLDILRFDNKADLAFGTAITTETEILDIVKKGGLIACLTNQRVKYFNTLINNGKEYKLHSKVRFIKNVLPKMIYNGLSGIITTLNITEIENHNNNTKSPTVIYDGTHKIERLEGLEITKNATLYNVKTKKIINQQITTTDLFIKVFINNRIIYYPLEKYKANLELSYASTVHKLQAQTLKCPLIFDNILNYEDIFENLKYTAYSRLTREADLYILTDYNLPDND